jgi:hypothetical protein
MSNALLSRLGKHCTGDLDFDEIDVVPVPEKYALKLETELIARHLPQHNKSKNPISAKTFVKCKVPMRTDQPIPVFCGT